MLQEINYHLYYWKYELIALNYSILFVCKWYLVLNVYRIHVHIVSCSHTVTYYLPLYGTNNTYELYGNIPIFKIQQLNNQRKLVRAYIEQKIRLIFAWYCKKRVTLLPHIDNRNSNPYGCRQQLQQWWPQHKRKKLQQWWWWLQHQNFQKQQGRRW